MSKTKFLSPKTIEQRLKKAGDEFDEIMDEASLVYDQVVDECQARCKHQWVHIKPMSMLDVTLEEYYQCNVCGKKEDREPVGYDG